MTTVSVPTPSQQAAAAALLDQPERWSHGRSKVDGREFWLIQGSQGAAHYATAYGCTCKGYRYRGVCSHVVAVTMREAREASQANPSELLIEATIAIRPTRDRYSDLFPEQD